MRNEVFRLALAEAAGVHPSIIDPYVADIADVIARLYGPARAAEIVQAAVIERINATITPAKRTRRARR